MGKIWVIGGTVETYIIAESLINHNKDFIVSVATDYGYEEFSKFQKYLVKAKMEKEQMIDFCKQNKISIIADVSHPYARNVSQNAIDTSKELGIEYYRYERKNAEKKNIDDNVYYVDFHTDAIKLIKEKNFRNVLLTTGINHAFMYISANLPNLFVRVLPRGERITWLENSGLPSKNIIAMQGPFSMEMNIATIHYTDADVLVTKQSGKAGGYDEKIQACKTTGISAIVVKRPDIEYVNQYSDIEKMIEIIVK